MGGVMCVSLKEPFNDDCVQTKLGLERRVYPQMKMTAVELAASHILEHLTEQRPLFVAVQGPQGSGKSYLSAELQNYLCTPPHSLHVAVLSIDDLYLPHWRLVSLAAAHPQNILWQGRGQPGTHDIDLGVKTLFALKAGDHKVELPQFDKSLFAGEGDRLPVGDDRIIVVEQPPPLDIVIVEGWCVGFYPISEDELLDRWNGVWKIERKKLGLGEDEMGKLEDLKAINHELKDYLRLWSFFDVFVQLKPNPPVSDTLSQYHVVYKWRLEQEHNMKARNGGRGMSDVSVKSFVDRYIPGYVFYGDSFSPATLHKHQLKGPKWIEKGLNLFLDESRTVTVATSF